MKDEVKKYLLDLLSSDEEVIRTLQNVMSFNNSLKDISIVANECGVTLTDNENLINEYKKRIELLNNQVSKLKNELKHKDEKIQEKNNKIDKIIKDSNLSLLMYKNKIKEIEQEKINIAEKLKEYKKDFTELKSVYEKYCGLDEFIIESLERILNKTSKKSETLEVFFAHGIQESNVVALWDLISQNYKEYENYDKLDDLKDIFTFFLELLTKISSKNIGIISPQPHEMYDERIHTRTKTSSAIGYVNSVVLDGFYIGRNILRKALVEVK